MAELSHHPSSQSWSPGGGRDGGERGDGREGREGGKEGREKEKKLVTGTHKVTHTKTADILFHYGHSPLPGKH